MLQEQLRKLKLNANHSAQSGIAGTDLHSLQNEATLLIRDTANIMKLLTGTNTHTETFTSGKLFSLLGFSIVIH